MTTRICYIHVGPHKTGTTSIQWYLKQNRAEFLKFGYFVPESGTIHGAHHPLVRQLCGQEMREHQKDVAARFSRAIKETASEVIVISSETLDGLLRNRDYAKAFFTHIGELNLEPKLVLFPRNQSQWINSLYSSVVRHFCRCESFEDFVQEVTQRPSARYSPLIELADTYNAELLAHPFTAEATTPGVIPEFLRAIGLDPGQFRDTNARRNLDVGPFTVSVARGVLRLIKGARKQIKWLQAARCQKTLATYLEENSLADAGYCGLTTALARHIERKFQPDNDAFAKETWGRPWAQIFATDICQEFVPNDFAISPPDESTERQLERAIHEIKQIAKEIMHDPALAVEAPWNDFQRRDGWTPRA